VQLETHVAAALSNAARQTYTAHHSDPNFTGCAVGFRRRAGQPTDEPVAIAMVVNKRPEAIVSQGRLLPKTVEVDGRKWGVDVVEVGPLSFRGSAAAGGVNGVLRPPVQGCGISNINDGITGTLGCLVRDQSDGTVCILSTNHVLARLNRAGNHELIIQPGLSDGGSEVYGIASLKRFVRLASGTSVDAAIAQLSDQAHISQAVANNLMAPISPSHPAVGMVVADDSPSCSRNCFLTRMDTTLSALGVKLLGDSGSSSAVVAPQIGMHIEKVGRCTGYTSSTIAATGAIVKVNWPPLGQINLTDLIWTQGLHNCAGDSGAVACVGGNGRTFADLPTYCDSGNCELLDALATYYQIPVNSAGDNTLAHDLRDQLLSQSATGQLIIAATYLNAQMIIDRLATETGSAHNQATAQARAQALYARYHDLAARLITSTSPADVVTESDLNTAKSILTGLTLPAPYGTGMTTTSETNAAFALYHDIVEPTLGMNRRQLIDYMNTLTVFQEVHDKMKTLANIKISGSVV
jgi:hypothetical protein